MRLFTAALYIIFAFALKTQADIYIQDSIPQMIQLDGKAFCASLDKKMPDARYMAAYAMAHGAKGILEPKDYTNQSGYMKINKLGSHDYNTVIDFYYNPSGFVPSETDLNSYWLWTTSHGPHNIDFAYVFNLKTGQFDFDARIQKNGVRCVPMDAY